LHNTISACLVAIEIAVDLQLHNKTAVVTGASKGIGRSAAEVLAEEGCNLVLVARNVDGLRALAADIQQRRNVGVRTCACDLSKPHDQQLVAEFASEADILINNAGSNPGGEIDEISEKVWRESWDLKVFGYISITRTYYSAMKARGSGVIINVIGNSGERMDSRYILGSSGNLALMGLTRALGGRSPDFGVRVVGVNPGLTATDRGQFMLRNWSISKFGTPDRAQEVLRDLNLPFGRMGKPREVADTIAFLASPRAAYISGTVVTVDGGAANRQR
jgi:NAD(P)-dependent dehydrogenase (short-subunit alcohol dehydrogenase family)